MCKFDVHVLKVSLRWLGNSISSQALSAWTPHQAYLNCICLGLKNILSYSGTVQNTKI